MSIRDDMRMGSDDIYQMITHIERAKDYRKPTIRKNLPVGYWRKQMLEHLGGV